MDIKIIVSCISIYCDHVVAELLDSFGCKEEEMTIKEAFSVEDDTKCIECGSDMEIVSIKRGYDDDL